MKLINNKSKGFTLIEVMIAVVVFSFGLLGVAGVMTVSVKNNQNGYMRSQAAFLASTMIEMMRSNQIALWNGLYNGTYNSYTALTSGNDCSTACNFTELRGRDVQVWSNMINQILPNSSGVVSCVSPEPPTTAIPIMIVDPAEPLLPDDPAYPSLPLIPCANCAIDPYNGFCTVTINWSESNEISATSAQSFVLVGKP
ncbi:MAG: type IV pilus modification protein PilV [Proteobacteria bacterium]|nr:type IV pilus modification protein PilV [Pseudomonadota bacterium]